MPLLIKNGEIITTSARYTADIYCENEAITRIDRNIDAPPGTEIIDATGKYVFPGFIDPHVHIYLPFMGTFSKDTYETGSKAALVGGTTTLIEMCCPSRKEEALAGFETWMSQAVGKSACDFTFHMGVTKFDDMAEAQLREIVKRGISSFKIFLAYKGAFGIDDTELYRTLKLAKELGVVVTAHCENETLVAERSKELLAAGKTDPGQHHESRPPVVEAEGVHHLMTFAELTGASTYIVHLSCQEALNEAIAARQRGVDVKVETLIQYLVLDKSYAERPNFEGAKYVMSPPLRDVRNQSVLWNGLRSGLVNTVATDHAPFDFKGQKPMGKDDFTKIPNGIPSLEERINLLYTYGVKTGKIDIHTLVDVASTQVAKTFDLFPRKGAIQPGSDADLVIFDPNYRGTISANSQMMNVDYSAFEGWKLEGRPSAVTVRGQVAVKNGKFVGTIGRGKFLERKPSHF
ncbi:dihydropyrimidinase [Pedosphaera parvula]|uniref:Dihydropyrimidinase n=1 Tax=Pedosphaera parvula (strain Ellin514) TaxID=320771 RepID=B9XKX9_PEDPL|nr:dihydropyrimidinase [Pedosphaera parvula]EEF59473.1 dihydropyrimidinase [Pedosphaera parvula Ellin514]